MENEINQIKKAAGYLCVRGWAEMNAGNISCRLDDDTYLVSASGSRMRDLQNDFENNALIVKDAGNDVKFEQFSDKELVPTSEIATHLAMHKFMRENKMNYGLIVHTHPDEIIALTQIKSFNSSAAINNMIWNVLPESKLLIPQGAAFVKYYLTGSRKLAEKSAAALAKSNLIIWEKHGCIAAAESAEKAIDIIDVFVKAVKIYFMICSAGFIPEGLTEKQMEELKNIRSH